MRVGYVRFLFLSLFGATLPLLAEDSPSPSPTPLSLTWLAPTEAGADDGLSNYNPDLQKLRDFRSVLRADDKYFHTVGWVYRNSGFRALGNALEFSGTIVDRLTDAASRPIPRQQAVRAVRRLQVALRDTPRYLPKFSKNHPYQATHSGFLSLSANKSVTYPNYTGLAFSYLSNLQTALYNGSKGRRITKNIPAPKRELWILVDPFSATYLVNGALFQNGTIYTPSGAYDYAGSSYSLGATNTISDTGLLSYGTLTLAGSGSMTLTLSGSNFQKPGTSGLHWVAFPPGMLIPDTLINEDAITLSASYTVNGVALPTGTKLFQVDNSFSVPVGAISLAGTDLSAVLTSAN